MKRFLLPLATSCILLVACSAPPAAAPPPKSQKTPISTIATSTKQTPLSTPTSARGSVAAPSSIPPKPMTFTILCQVGKVYPTYQDAWVGNHVKDKNKCYDAPSTGVAFTSVQQQAYEAGAIPSDAAGQLYRVTELYKLCAMTGQYSPGNYTYKSEAEAQQASAQLVLCPDHPYAAAIQIAIDAYRQGVAATSASVAAAAESARARIEGISDGSYASPGKHLVGSEIRPGTWQSVDDRVEDCYWELSDSTGEIIDNNFISVAPQFTINIPSDVAGFTNSGCAFQRIGD